MEKCLLMIDMQKGFISERTNHVVERVRQLVEQDIFSCMLATKFINIDNSPYRDFLHWDRFSKDSDETKLLSFIEEKSNRVYEKYVYTAVNPSLLTYLRERNIQEVYLLGINTDCCVLKTAVDLFEVGIRPVVLAYYCASNGGMESQDAAIRVLQRLIGKDNVWLSKIAEKCER